MANWRYLQFFDKNGKNYNFDYDADQDTWTGTIYLPQVSTLLFEVGQLFILQEFIDANTSTRAFGYPHGLASGVGGSTATPGTGGCGWLAEWQTTDPTEIFLFTFNREYVSGIQSSLIREPDGPPIEIYDEIEYLLDSDPNEVVGTDGLITTDLITSAALQVDFAINSKEENTYKRTLIIRDTCTNTIVAKFLVVGETIGEDERLKVMTQNMGYGVLANDSLVFRDTDVNELLPDWLEVNTKRKEMMLEGQNIYTFIGSYKGLVNAIKFFGYDNLQIKEFWKNVDKTSPNFGKYVQSNPISAFDPAVVNWNGDTITLPNKKYRKTSMFSLIYRINQIKPDQFDIDDLPLTEETSDFTLEEVLIKLFGLKRKLEKEFLPLNAHIKDIVGEADFFGLNELTNTISRNDKNVIRVGIDADFRSVPGECIYLQDLRSLAKLLTPCARVGFSLVGNSYICPIPGYPGQNLVLGPYNTGETVPLPPVGPDPYGQLGVPVDGDGWTIAQLADFYLAYFSRYAPNINTLEHIPGRSSNRLPDQPDIPVGAPMLLENTSFGQLTWDDINSNWIDLEAGGVYYNIDFEPVDPVEGDIFTLTDPVTGTFVSYTAAAGNNATTVRNALFAQAQALRTSLIDPWLIWDISAETTPSGPTIRFYGESPNRLVATVDRFQPYSNAQFREEQLPGPNLYTWESILRGNFQEIEWTIFKEADNQSPEFYYNIRGPLVDLDQLPLVLPYVGNYTVEIKLFDLYNNISSKVKQDYICVEPKEVEFSGWYQARKLDYTWSSEGNYKWKDYGAFWDLPIEPSTTWEEETPSLYESLDIVNAILNNFGVGATPDFSLMNFQDSGAVSFSGPYYWDNLDRGDWDDTYHLWWDMTCLSGDTPAFFQFAEVVPNTYLQIVDANGQVGRHFFGLDPLTLRDAVSQLNLSTEPIISKYIYNLVLNAAEQQIYVQAVARYSGHYGDFQDVDIVDVDGNRICAGPITGATGSTGEPITGTGCESIIFRQGQHRSCNPTWNTAKFINDGKVLPRMTWSMFVYDKCQIAGKDKPRWRITNIDDPNASDIYFESKYLTYLFKDLGRYEIALELEDSNGNKYSKSRNMLVIV
jgi:hypothetical protein